VWRTIKAVSQLVIISFAFWGGVSGTINPTYAFAGMLVIYLGVERFEDMLANEGQRQAQRANNVTVSETSDEDPRKEHRREDSTNDRRR